MSPGMPSRVAVCFWTVCALVLLAGCGESGSQAPAPTAEPQTHQAPETPQAGIADLPAGWTQIDADEPAICSDGSPYKFFVRPGDPEKLLFYMVGGGACWFRQNCDPAMQPSYTVNLEGFEPRDFGIFDAANPANPFADYSVVAAPYCSADSHLGAADTEYPAVEEGQTPLTIRHRGSVNVQAVLDWTYENVPAPERIFVTGSSAGSIPSPVYASVIADHYPDARVAQLGDGAGGYRRAEGGVNPTEKWGTVEFLRQVSGFEDAELTGFNFEQLYIAAARRHPDILFAEYDAAEDSVQKRFLALAGSDTTELIDALRANQADIRAAVPNFRSFVAGGESHTILGRPEFYAFAANGVSVRDWVAALAEFETPEDVSCVGCAVEELVTSSPE